MVKRIVCFLAVLQVLACRAATVDTIFVQSAKMGRTIPCVVIRPDCYNDSGTVFPVVYLLHGYSGNYSNWVNKVPSIKAAADQCKIMIVCMDGAFSSWYINSPVDSSMRYEDFTSDELPAYIDTHYHTIKSRFGRAIAGLSMGGYGSLMVAFLHPTIFGACGSISGAVNLSGIYNRFDIAKRFGDTTAYASVWEKYVLKNIIQHYSQKDALAIIMDCGTEDYFIKDNRTLDNYMTQLGIQHDYTERPGNHNWDYWSTSIGYQLVFFVHYFDAYRYVITTKASIR